MLLRCVKMVPCFRGDENYEQMDVWEWDTRIWNRQGKWDYLWIMSVLVAGFQWRFHGLRGIDLLFVLLRRDGILLLWLRISRQELRHRNWALVLIIWSIIAIS